MSHIKLGKYNQLEVVKEVDFGVYLNGDEDGEILLPKRYVPEGTKPGDILNVFIYLDMEERLVATTLQPYVQVGEFACLQVAWVNQFGAFLDWGLMKDLFVPFREQKMKMQKGKRYVVHVHLDEESYRIVASAKVEHYLSTEKPEYQPGQEVNVMVWQRTDLGYKVIVENQFSGMLFHNEVFQPLEAGMLRRHKEKKMRLDKFLKVSRLIKRRTVANEACDAGRVMVNGKPAKASVNVKVGDIIEIGFGTKTVKVRVLDLQDTTKKEEAKDLFEYVS